MAHQGRWRHKTIQVCHQIPLHYYQMFIYFSKSVANKMSKTYNYSSSTGTYTELTADTLFELEVATISSSDIGNYTCWIQVGWLVLIIRQLLFQKTNNNMRCFSYFIDGSTSYQLLQFSNAIVSSSTTTFLKLLYIEVPLPSVFAGQKGGTATVSCTISYPEYEDFSLETPKAEWFKYNKDAEGTVR